MPKSKFDAFYYGIGMKLDEASVDQAGKQLEGKLNKVVDKVATNLTKISDAVSKGVKDVDTKKLVQSIVDAQKELRSFQDFDPSKLQKQIDSLRGTVETLSDSLGDVGTRLKSFADDVQTRLGNIEIKTSKQAKDVLKSDLQDAINVASLLQRQLKAGLELDSGTLATLDRYFAKIEQGMNSIYNSGNPLEDIVDKGLAESLVKFATVLRNIGDPVNHIRDSFSDLVIEMRYAAEDKGIKTFSDSLSYRFEEAAAALRASQKEIEEYEKKIDSLRRKTDGYAVLKGTKDNSLIEEFDAKQSLKEFDAIIQKINEYQTTLKSLTGEDYLSVSKELIALVETVENRLRGMGKKQSKPFLDIWNQQFGVSSVESGNKLSTQLMAQYDEVFEQLEAKLRKEMKNIQEQVVGAQNEIDALLAKEGRNKNKTSSSTRNSTTQKQKADGVVAEIKTTPIINTTEWAKTINAALAKLSQEGKIKPVKIPVATTQGETLKKIQEQAKKIREMALANPQDDGGSDIKSFNHKFSKFLGNLRDKKDEIATFLKDEWKPVLKDAFSFRMELLGIDNKSMTDNIATHMLPTVDAINAVLESKPIIFHSNIETLVEEVKSKLQDIKIDIGAGNVNINPQGLSNANIIINGIVGRGGVSPSVNTTTTQPVATPVIQPEPSAHTETSTATSDGTVDLQAIYNDAANKIKTWLDGFTDPQKALEGVQKQAKVLWDRLRLAGEGTQEYYEAQIQLTTLLSKWRYKIGGAKADPAFKVPGVMGRGAKPAKNWNQYLIDNGILPDPQNDRVIASASKLETLYGLDNPGVKSSSTKTPKPSKDNSVQTVEQQMANQLEAGRAIIENYIKLAKWAKALGPIAEGADIEIKESDFKDRDTINRRGNVYKKDDIGTVIPGKKITFEDLDAFIAEYEQSENEEDRQLFNFLKNLIDAYKSNQHKLDVLLDELSDSDVVGRYEFSDNKKETLATDTQSAYKTIMGKRGSKKAQQHLADVFGKYNIDLSALPSAKTYAEQWQIIEQQIIGRKGLDFDSLMSELGSLKGNVGKTYENFMTLLKVSRAYMLASNSLGEVGQEASVLMRGKKERVDREIRKYDPSTGRSYGTGEYIEGGSNKIVTEGLRQEIRKLAVVFIDELGNAIAGVNAGKNIADDYLGITDNTSFTKIITFLTTALNQSAEIAFDTRKKSMKGYKDVTKWDADNYAYRQNAHIEEYKNWTTTSTEKSELGDRIHKLQENITKYEAQLSELEKELEDTNVSSDNRNTILSLSSNIDSKQSDVTSQKEKAHSIIGEIESIKKQIDNPETVYEDIVTQLLTHKENLYALQKRLKEEKQADKNGTNFQTIDKLKEQIEKEEKNIKKLEENAKTAKRDVSDKKSTDLIAKEENTLNQLKEQLAQHQEDAQYKADKKTLDELAQQQEPLLARLRTLRSEIKQIQESSGNNPSQEQSNTIQQKQQEIDSLVAQTTELQKQKEALQKKISPQEDEMSYLSKLITAKESYIDSLKNIGDRKRVQTTDELNKALNSKLEKLEQTNEEITKLENEIVSLESQLMQIGDADTVQLVRDITSKIGKLKGTIELHKSQLDTTMAKYESANGDEIIYSKSYEQASSDLPMVSEELQSRQTHYKAESKAYTMMRDIGLVRAKASSQEEYDELLKVALPLEELNKKLLSGKMTEKEYTDQIAKAHILILDMSKEEAEEEARALKDQILRIHKLEEEKRKLEEIIRTKKPSEEPISNPTSQDSNPSKSKQKDGKTSSTQPVSSDVQPTNDGGYSMVDGGNVVLNLNDDSTSSAIESFKSVLGHLATSEKQDDIIGLLKNGIKVSGKTDEKSTSGGGTTEKKARAPQMPNVAKATIQEEEISKLTNINKDSSLYNQYLDSKERLDEAISSATAKGKDRTKDDTDQIRTLLSDVIRLGKQIIKTSEAFDKFKERGGKSFAETITDVDALKNKMFELASENALSSKMLMRDISYDDMTQKMSYNLIDLEGNVTRVTMAYNELVGAILTTSDKSTNSASKIYNAIEGEMINRIGVNDTVGKTPSFEQSYAYQEYIKAYDAMMKAQDDLRVKGEMATKEERDNLISLTNTVANTREEFEHLVKASIDFDAKVQGKTGEFVLGSDLSEQMKKFVLTSNTWTKSQKEMIEQTWNFKDAQNAATYSVVDGNKQLLSMTVVADEGTRRIGQYTAETKKYTSAFGKFMTSLKGKWQEVARYLMSFGSLYRVWAVLKQGVTYIKEIDSALTELKKVTNETEATYDRFLDTAAKTADKVGSTITNIVNSTADWARLGYSMEEAARLAESTAVLLNVSEFSSIEDATSALTSTLQAFGYTADQGMYVVDVLNEVKFLASLYSDVYDKDGYIGKTLGTDNSEERF